MKKRSIILSIIFLVFIVPILVINLTIIIKGKLNPEEIPDFMGYKPFVVLSGSMESSINIGDLVIVKETDINDIKKDDIIAFKNEDIVITHRVIEVINDGNSVKYKSKGDNNNVEDDFLVNAEDVEGVYLTKISGLGNALMFLSKPIGMLVIILTVIVIAGLIFFITFKPSKKDEIYMKEFEEYKKKKELENSKK